MPLTLRAKQVEQLRLRQYLNERGYEFEQISGPNQHGVFAFHLHRLEVKARAVVHRGVLEIRDYRNSKKLFTPTDLKMSFNTLFYS